MFTNEKFKNLSKDLQAFIKNLLTHHEFRSTPEEALAKDGYL